MAVHPVEVADSPVPQGCFSWDGQVLRISPEDCVRYRRFVVLFWPDGGHAQEVIVESSTFLGVENNGVDTRIR
jgi:hypothetical protein